MLAWVIGAPANAAPVGTSPVAGAPVNLIQIDATGTQVGSALATATTDMSGNYSLNAPAAFTPAANFVVRASGTTASMDAIVIGTTLNVDPSTEAHKLLVLGSVTAVGGIGATLAALPLNAVAEIASEIAGLLNGVNLGSATTATAMANALVTAVKANEEVFNLVTSVAQAGVISGSVTDSTGAGLPNIIIRILDFNNWVLRAQTRTGVSGNYTLNVPPSLTQGYVVGAMNFTTASFAASEWFKAGGHGTTPFQGDRVTVAAGTPAIVNMQLANGARVTGTVTQNGTNIPLPGVRIIARELSIGAAMAWMGTRLDGSFTMNGPITTPFVLLAENHTLQAFATGSYNGPASGGSTTAGGAVGADRGTVLSAPSAGLTVMANFGLVAGQQVAGIVTIGPNAAAVPVPGTMVQFIDSVGEFVTANRADLAGLYRVWLKPNASSATAYVVRSRGQKLPADLSVGSVTANFVAQVNSKSLTLSDGANPVSQVPVLVYDATTAATNPGAAFEGVEVSNGDGSVTVFTTSNATTTKELVAKVNGPRAGIGAGVYSGGLSLGAGTTVLFDGTSLGPVTLPAGVTLSGTVTVTTNGLPPAPGNYNIQVFNGGTATANFFVNTFTKGDGGYAINLPGGTYSVRSCQAGTATCSAFQSVTIAPPTVPGALNFTM
jgi:hypothetical protein